MKPQWYSTRNLKKSHILNHWMVTACGFVVHDFPVTDNQKPKCKLCLRKATK